MVNYSKFVLVFLLCIQPITPVVAGSSNFNGMSPRTANAALCLFAGSAVGWYGLTKLQGKATILQEPLQRHGYHKIYETGMTLLSLVKYTTGALTVLSFCAYVGNAGYSFARTTKAQS